MFVCFLKALCMIKSFLFLFDFFFFFPVFVIDPFTTLWYPKKYRYKNIQTFLINKVYS